MCLKAKARARIQEKETIPMKKYAAPELFVDSFAADTMIASANNTKNGNAGNNQNCWGCNESAGATDTNNTQNSCVYTPDNPAVYAMFC